MALIGQIDADRNFFFEEQACAAVWLIEPAGKSRNRTPHGATYMRFSDAAAARESLLTRSNTDIM